MSKKILITGATSGIGAALAKELVKRGHTVALTGRREENLQALQRDLGSACHIYAADVTDKQALEKALSSLTNSMGGLDIMIANAGVGYLREGQTSEKIREMVDVNVVGFTDTVNWATEYFVAQGKGHIVGISSVAALYINSTVPAYNATKFFVSAHLGGLRAYFKNNGLNIAVTDIRPGYVNTAMTANVKNKIWESSPQKAASQIADAIERKARIAYITKRWRIISWVGKLLRIMEVAF